MRLRKRNLLLKILLVVAAFRTPNLGALAGESRSGSQGRQEYARLSAEEYEVPLTDFQGAEWRISEGTNFQAKSKAQADQQQEEAAKKQQAVSMAAGHAQVIPDPWFGTTTFMPNPLFTTTKPPPPTAPPTPPPAPAVPLATRADVEALRNEVRQSNAEMVAATKMIAERLQADESQIQAVAADMRALRGQR